MLYCAMHAACRVLHAANSHGIYILQDYIYRRRARHVPRAACSPFPNESKRIESEVIATKSLKKGVLTLVTRRRAVYPAALRQRAKLGLALHAACG